MNDRWQQLDWSAEWRGRWGEGGRPAVSDALLAGPSVVESGGAATRASARTTEGCCASVRAAPPPRGPGPAVAARVCPRIAERRGRARCQCSGTVDSCSVRRRTDTVPRSVSYQWCDIGTEWPVTLDCSVTTSWRSHFYSGLVKRDNSVHHHAD